MTKLKDLYEFRYDHERKVFVKHQAIKTNVPDALAYSVKKTEQSKASFTTRFAVVENGALQYSNAFPPILKRKMEKWKKEIESSIAGKSAHKLAKSD